MKSVPVLASVSLVLLASTSGAQSRGDQQNAQPTHQNLKVLPPDITQPQLLQTMQGFSQALGEPSAERGGRAKRYFQITGKGTAEVRDTQRMLTNMWRNLTGLQGESA